MIAFLNENRRDPAESLRSYVRIGCRLNLAGGRHERYQAFLVGHFGRLHSDYTLVRLVHTEQYNPAEHYYGTRANCHFMPRLHAIPLRLTALYSPAQTSAADFRFKRLQERTNPRGNKC